MQSRGEWMEGNRKNMFEFLDQILSMDDFENEVLAQEIAVNFERLRTIFGQIPPQLNLIHSHLNSLNKTSFTSLKIINKKIRTQELVSEKTLQMLLTSEPKRGQTESKFQQYKSLIIASLFLQQLEKTDTKDSNFFAQEMRLLMTGKSSVVVNKLPDLKLHREANFQTEWDDLIRSKEANQSLHQRLKSLLKATLNFLSFMPPEESKETTSSRPKWYKEGFVKQTTKADFDDQTTLQSFVSHIDIESIDEQDWNTLDEDSLLVESSKQSLNTPTSITQDYELEKRKAKSVAANIVRQKLRLNCSTSQATKHEIETLLTYCLSSNSQTSQYLLLMLFSGKDITKESKLLWVKTSNVISGYIIEYELPTQKEIPFNEAKFITTTVEIPLPTMEFQQYPRFPLSQEQTEKCKLAINNINKNHGTKITLSKVTEFFSQYLKQQNLDIIFDAVFSGADIRNCPALFYTQVSSSSLLRIQEKYLALLNQFLLKRNVNFPMPNFNISTSQLLGSPIPLSEEKLKTMFNTMQEKIIKIVEEEPNCHKGHLKTGTSYLFHICYTVFVQTVITFSSGYRPVNDWGGTLKDYFVEEGMLWISDKEYIKGDNSRFIILPSIAIDILKQYVQYLENLNRNISPEHYKTKAKIKSILDGDEHLFFFFSQVDQPKRFKPKHTWSMQISLGETELLQANWGRHQIRTYLHTQGIPTEYISAWMGHSLGHIHSHGHYSSLSNDGPQLIANQIDTLLQNLGVEAFVW